MWGTRRFQVPISTINLMKLLKMMVLFIYLFFFLQFYFYLFYIYILKHFNFRYIVTPPTVQREGSRKKCWNSRRNPRPETRCSNFFRKSFLFDADYLHRELLCSRHLGSFNLYIKENTVLYNSSFNLVINGSNLQHVIRLI